MKIYLAGPITGCTYDGCTNWREAFKLMMLNVINSSPDKAQWRPDEIQCLSPMRAKEYLEKVGEIHNSYPELGVLASDDGIMSRDYFDCCRADLVVANLLGAKIPTLGTVMEMAWAFQNRTPLIVAMEDKGNLHEHPMIRKAINFRVNSLDEAARTALMVGWPHD